MKIELKLTKKQGEFVSAGADEVLFGGAAGGGKSFGQLMDAMLYALRYPRSKQLILRRTYPELDKSLIRVAQEVYPGEKYTATTPQSMWGALSTARCSTSGTATAKATFTAIRALSTT